MGWMRSGLASPALAFALAASSALPSRIAIAAEQSVGAGRLFYLAGGLLSDVSTVGPIFVLTAALLSFFPQGAGRRRRFDVGVPLLLTLFGVSLLAQNAAAEFRIERGVLPGPIDLRQGFGHRDFFTAELPLLVVGRFWWSNALSVAVALVVTSRLRAGLTPADTRLRHARGFVFAVAVTISLVIASRHADAYCGAMNNGDALKSPSAALVTGLLTGARYDGSAAATRRLLATHLGTSREAAEGARNLGFPSESALRLERFTTSDAGGPDAHPLARPLDSAAEAEASGLSEPPLLIAARGVSHELFRGGDERGAPIVFHVSLESMRADDIHALDAAAPAAIAPFSTAVYSDDPSVAAFVHAHQSGVRTSQALGAVMCGLGALPFHLSAARDLGALPLRCIPDVLADAGFHGRAFYGHEFVFDDMESFLRSHRMSLTARGSFPSSAPRGVWEAVSDASVYDAAVDDAESAPKESARYEFVLTLSHHAPYTSPTDLSPAHRAEIESLCRERALRGEDCDRLRTMRYADEALRRFIARVESSEIASRSVIVVSGDHTVHRWVPWGKTDGPEGITRIPLFVWLPRALRRSVHDPDALAVAWDRFRALAREQPISNSDVPTLLLAILGGSAPLQSLAPDARWHTLGGQVTSPHYRSVTGRGVAHGIDAHGYLFDVAETGAVRPSGTRMESLRGLDDITRAEPHSRSEVAFLGTFLRGYVARR